MNETLCWLAIWSTILWGVGVLRGTIGERQPFKTVLLPGLMLDALIRGTSYALTATPMSRVSPLADGHPVLPRARSNIRYLGLPLSIVLRFTALVAIAYTCLLEAPEFLTSGFALPLLDRVTIRESGVEWTSLPMFWASFTHLPEQLHLSSIWSMLLLYTGVSYFVGAALKGTEYLAALLICGGLALLTWAGAWLGVTFGFLSRGWFIRWLYVPELWSSFSLLVVLSLLCLLLTAILAGATKLFGGGSAEE